MAPRGAGQTRGIDPVSVCLPGAIEMLVLSIDAGEQRADRRQLVAADATVDDRLCTRLRVEAPAPVAFDEGDGKRPVLRADVQLRAPGVCLIDHVLLVVESNEALTEFLVGIPVT